LPDEPADHSSSPRGIGGRSPQVEPSASSGAGLGASLPCRRCRYETRGLPPEGACPECGEPIWRTIAQAVDLTAAALHPKVARRLAILLPVLVLGTTLVMLAAIAGRGPWLPFDPGDLARSRSWDHVMLAISVAGGCLLLAASLGLRDRPADESIRPGPASPDPLELPRRLLVVVALAWLAAAGTSLEATVAIPGGLVRALLLGGVLLGVGLVAERLGPSSRLWRTAGIARQGPWVLVSTVAVALVAAGLARIAAILDLEEVATALGLAASVAMLLAGIGTLYLGLNLMWIARDLFHRRPAIERLLEGRSLRGEDQDHRSAT